MSLKHKGGKERIACKAKYERDICESLKSYDKKFHPVGDTLPDSTRIYRIRVVTTMLKAVYH